MKKLMMIVFGGVLFVISMTGCASPTGHTIIGPWSALQDSNQQSDRRAILNFKGFDGAVGGPSAAVDVLALFDKNSSLTAGQLGDVATYVAAAWVTKNGIQGKNLLTGQSSTTVNAAPSVPATSAGRDTIIIQGNGNNVDTHSQSANNGSTQ